MRIGTVSDLASILAFIILIISGCGGGSSTGVDTNRDSTDEWTVLSSMPTARSELGVASVNGKIYAIGGISASTLPDVEEYDPLTDSWTRKANMPTARRLMVVAAVNDKIYVIGGVDGTNPNSITYTNVTEEYDPSTDTWSTKSPFPIGSASNNVLGNQYIGGAAANGKIYIVNFNATGFSTESPTYIYDPLSDTWETGSPIPYAGSRYSVAALNNVIYVYASGKFVKYDEASDVWLLVPSPNEQRRHAQIVAATSKIYAVGGIAIDSDNNYLDVLSVVEEFEPSTETWTYVQSMPTARHSNGLVAIDGDIYVIGGSDIPSFYTPAALDCAEVRNLE